MPQQASKLLLAWTFYTLSLFSYRSTTLNYNNMTQVFQCNSLTEQWSWLQSQNSVSFSTTDNHSIDNAGLKPLNILSFVISSAFKKYFKTELMISGSIRRHSISYLHLPKDGTNPNPQFIVGALWKMKSKGLIFSWHLWTTSQKATNFVGVFEEKNPNLSLQKHAIFMLGGRVGVVLKNGTSHPQV